jgi:hypothetical protein
MPFDNASVDFEGIALPSLDYSFFSFLKTQIKKHFFLLIVRLESDYCVMYFRINATIAKTITREPKAESAVVRVKPKGVKLKKSATKAVTAKLNPMEKVNRSIMSITSSLGKSASFRQ